MAARAAARESGSEPAPGLLSPAAKPILDAALTRFREVGYHGTTVRDIARATGLNVAAMYHYFDSKQDLLLYIMRDAMEENLRAVERAAATSTDPRDQLTAIVSAIVDYHTRHQTEAFVGNSELRSLEEEGAAVIIGLRDREEKVIHSVVQRGVESGAFAVVETKQATRAILAMCSAVATWFHPGGALTAEDVRREYVQLAMNLVRAV